MRPEALAAAAPYRLVLPGHPLAGRSGDRLGHGTGSSLEFMDYRDYVPGDDLRHVDWRAYARTDQLKVRLFREETAPSLDLVLDTSASMAVTDLKREALLDLAAAAASWTRQAGGRPRTLAADGGRIEDLDALVPGGPDAGALSPRVPLRRRALRMVISDFLSPEDPGPRLRRFTAGASHLYVIQLLDPWEADPAARGETTLIDVEADTRLDVVLDRAGVDRYRVRLGRLVEAVRRATRAVGGTYARVLASSPRSMFREHLLPENVVEPS